MSTQTLLWRSGEEQTPATVVLVAVECAACGGTGLVAPDAFGEWVPWRSYVGQVEAWERARGLDPETCGSAIRSGLIRPMVCPECRAARGNAAEG